MLLIQKQKNLLTGSCATALNLFSINTQLKTHPSGISSKCEINLTTHESKYGNSSSKLNLADLKLNKMIISPVTQTERRVPFTLRESVRSEIKNHTHVKKVVHTSEFIFWNLLTNLKNKLLKKLLKWTNKNEIILIFTMPHLLKKYKEKHL